MFTPHMTEEELQAAAYKDFLEMRIKVKIAFEQFIYRMRFTGGKRGVLHSLFEEKKGIDQIKKYLACHFCESRLYSSRRIYGRLFHIYTFVPG